MSRKTQGRQSQSPVVTHRTGYGAGLIEATVLLAAVCVPLFFNPASERVFEPDKLAWVVVLAALCLAGFAWCGIVDGRRPGGARFGNVEVAVVLALLSVTLGTVFAPRQALSLWGSYRRDMGLVAYGSFAVLFAGAAVSLSSPAARWRLVRAIAVGLIPLSAYAVLQRFGIDSLAWEAVGPSPADRAFGALGNPIFLGAYLLLALPFVAAALARRGDPSAIRSAAYATALILALAALVAAASRGPILGWSAGVGTGVVLSLAISGRRRLAAVVLAIGALSAAAGLVAAGADLPLPGVGRAVWESRTATERLLLWDLVLQRTAADPRVLAVGYGPDGLGPALTPYLNQAIVSLTPDQAYDRAHNLILEWGIAGGLAAVLAFGLVFAAAFAAGLRRLGAVLPRGAPLWILVAAAAGGTAAGLLRPAIAPLGAVAAALVTAIALGIRGMPTDSARAAGGVAVLLADSGALLALAALTALAGHMAEASFGLPTAPATVLLWLVVGLLAALGRDGTVPGAAQPEEEDVAAVARAPKGKPPDSGAIGAVIGWAPAAAEGIVDGAVMATVAFAPLLLPSPIMTGRAPLLWLLLPATWIAGDAMGEASSESPWVRPGARLAVILGFGALFAVHPRLQPGGPAVAFAVTLVAAALALAVVLGRIPIERARSEAEGDAAVPTPDDPVRLLLAAAATTVLLAAAWHVAVRPERADSLILASLAAGARGDHEQAIRDAEGAVAIWPEQPALMSYVAAAHRSVMLDSRVAADLRDAAYERAQDLLEDGMRRAPSADGAAKLAELHLDRGDALLDRDARHLAWTRAVEWYDRSLDLQPVGPAAMTGYAAALERLGEHEGASSLYRGALAIDPPRHSARAGLVRTLLSLADVDAAVQAIEAGLAIDGKALETALEAAAGGPTDPLRTTQSRVLYLIVTRSIDHDRPLVDALSRDAPDDPVTRALMALVEEAGPAAP